ncbi:MAG: plasmid stabilization protein [Planctomycetaceae bacterium]|nr:plasmid stabilization protein [Planctomycetaceae bacterium]
MNRFSLSHAANLDLVEIVYYIFERNPAAAAKFHDRLHSKFAMLSRQPLIGEECSKLGSEMRCFPEGNYIIFYIPTDDGIKIMRILHGWRNITQIFEGK